MILFSSQIEAVDSGEGADLEPIDSTYDMKYIIHKNTEIKFVNSRSKIHTQNNNIQHKIDTEKNSINSENLHTKNNSKKDEIDYTVCRKIFTDFGGYEKEVFEAILC